MESLFATGIFLFVLLISIITYLLFQAIFSTYFHPLSRYPGPKFAAVSQIPIAVRIWNGTLHLWLKRLHDEFDSDIVRVSPNEVSLISPAAWKDVYSPRPGHAGFPKSPVGFGGKNSILTADDADHSRMRRLLSHAFSEKALREQQPLIQVHIDNLIQGIRVHAMKTSSGLIDVVDWCHWVTFDIIGDLAFGEPFNCLIDAQYTPWIEKLIQGLKAVASVSVAARFRLADWFLRQYISRSNMVKDAIQHGKLSKEKVARRLEKGSSRPDFISYIVKHNTERAGMTQVEIDRQASVFINAGSQTTATFLCGALWFSLQHPQHVHRIRQELKDVQKTKDLPTIYDLNKLTFLHAYIQECHRMYPGSLAGLPRAAALPGDAADGHFIPGGTGVHLNQYAAYRSPRNFRRPDSFVPDRWLRNEEFASDRREILQPFAMGPRNCLGKNLANAEVLMIFSALVLAFDFVPCEKTDAEWLDQRAWFGFDKKKLFVKAVPR